MNSKHAIRSLFQGSKADRKANRIIVSTLLPRIALRGRDSRNGYICSTDMATLTNIQVVYLLDPPNSGRSRVQSRLRGLPVSYEVLKKIYTVLGPPYGLRSCAGLIGPWYIKRGQLGWRHQSFVPITIAEARDVGPTKGWTAFSTHNT